MSVISKYLTVLLVIMQLTSCIKEKTTPSADLKVGDAIPSFSVVMNDGSIVTGEKLSSGISCIVFFHTSCPDCKEAMPAVQKLYDEYLPQGVSFALISRSEGAESVDSYWKECGYTMPYSAQNDDKVYKMFAPNRVPRVYICRDGIIRAIFTDDPTPDYNTLKDSMILQMQ